MQAHTDAACLFLFSFMFRRIPRSFQIAGLTTSCTAKRKHHYFGASLFISLCTRLQEFWTLVRACLGSQGYRCHHSRCSIPRNQLQSPSLQTCRSEWCHLRIAHPPLLPDSPTSARQSVGERKSVISQSGQSLGDGRWDSTRLLRIWLAVRYYTVNKQVANKLEKKCFSQRSWEILKFTISAQREDYYTWE